MTVEQKNEVLLRMRLLHLREDIIQKFKESETICASSGSNGFRLMTEDEQKIFDDFKAEFRGGIPFYVIPNSNNLASDDELMCILQVSCFESDWPIERSAIMSHDSVSAFIHNYTYPEFSEPQMVQVVNTNGILSLT